MAASIAIRSCLHRRLRSCLPPVWGAAALLLGGLLSGMLGCGSDTNGPTLTTPSQLYWAMQLNARAITLALTAPYDTVQLTGTPITLDGQPLPERGGVTYHASDSTVTVSPTGLLTAHYLTSQTYVVASLTIGGITHVDTAIIKVTATRPFALASLSIQPQPDGLDSAKVALRSESQINQFNGNIPVYALDSSGVEQCTVYPGGCPFPVDFTSSNPEVATLDSRGYLTGNDIGKTTFRAAALVYGVYKEDSLVFTEGYPINVTMNFAIGPTGAPQFTANGLIAGTGGHVAFFNALAQPIVLVFPYQTQQIRLLNGPTYQFTDTIQPQKIKRFAFDSNGTYVAHLTLLGGPGVTASGTLNVSSGP